MDADAVVRRVLPDSGFASRPGMTIAGPAGGETFPAPLAGVRGDGGAAILRQAQDEASAGAGGGVIVCSISRVPREGGDPVSERKFALRRTGKALTRLTRPPPSRGMRNACGAELGCECTPRSASLSRSAERLERGASSGPAGCLLRCRAGLGGRCRRSLRTRCGWMSGRASGS